MLPWRRTAVAASVLAACAACGPAGPRYVYPSYAVQNLEDCGDFEDEPVRRQCVCRSRKLQDSIPWDEYRAWERGRRSGEVLPREERNRISNLRGEIDVQCGFLATYDPLPTTFPPADR